MRIVLSILLLMASGRNLLAEDNTSLLFDGMGAGTNITNALYIGKDGTNNSLRILNGGSVTGITAEIGFNGGGKFNFALVDGRSLWTNSSFLVVGDYGSTNRLDITGSGMVFNAAGTIGEGNLTFPTFGNDNRVTVSGSGSLWSCSGALSLGKTYGFRNELTVTNGGVVVVKAGLVVGGSGLSNQLAIINGSLVTNTTATIGNGANGSTVVGNNNRVLVSGNGSTWLNSGAFSVGLYGSYNQLTVTNNASVIIANTMTVGFYGLSNQMLIAGGGSVSNTYGTVGGSTSSRGSLAIVDNATWRNSDQFVVGQNASDARLIVTNGGKVLSLSSATSVIGNGVGSNNSVLVTGTQSLWTNTPQIRMAASTGGNNFMTIRDGATVYCSALLVGMNTGNNGVLIEKGGKLISVAAASGNFLGVNYAYVTNNQIRVTGPGSLWQIPPGGSLNVGNNLGGALGSGTVLIDDSGLVEVNTIYVGSNLVSGAQSALTNSGGILQFTTATPALTIRPGGRLTVTNGAISFRAIVNADVLCNQAGKSLDSASKVVWGGANTFRLNAATNLAGQSYTFTDTMGATNFARLELVNGSKYNGNVTIGSGGALGVSGGASSITGALTLASGASLAMTVGGPGDYLSVTGAVNLGGATLQLGLATNPASLYPIRLVRAAGGLNGTRFGNNLLSASFAGQPYALSVHYTATEVVLTAAARGALISIR